MWDSSESGSIHHLAKSRLCIEPVLDDARLWNGLPVNAINKQVISG